MKKIANKFHLGIQIKYFTKIKENEKKYKRCKAKNDLNRIRKLY